MRDKLSGNIVAFFYAKVRQTGCFQDDEDADDADAPSDEGSGGKKRKRAKVVEVEKIKKETRPAPSMNQSINSAAR